MNNCFRCLTATILISVFTSHTASAALVGYWHFNGETPGTITSGNGDIFAADQGSGTLITRSGDAGTNLEVASTGSTVNAIGATPAGNEIRLRRAARWNDDSVDIAFDAAGYQDIKLSLAARTVAGGVDTYQASYSINGGVTFVDLGSPVSLTGSYDDYEIDFGSNVDNRTTSVLRLTWSGAAGGPNTGDYAGLDNVQVNGTLGALGPPLAPQTIFEDPFNLDPSANGWTETPAPGVEIDDNGGSGQARFYRPSGGNGGNDDSTITRTLSTEGFEDLYFSIDGERFDTSFESADFVAVRFDFNDGNGFQDFFVSSGNGDIFSGANGLPVAAADNPNVMIQIVGNFNAGTEGYLFDSFNLSGFAIPSTNALPEPATATLVGIVCIICGGLRRRQPARR